MRLLSRTTRSVAPTEAGEQLLARLRPALTDVQDALDQLSGLRDKPAGRVRLLVPRLAGTMVLGPKLAKFTRDYPDVVLEITADDSRMDIVAGGFDAGIHFGEYIQKDMIAVRVSKDHRAAIVGAPSYFKSHPEAENAARSAQAIVASTSGMDPPASTDGSSTRARSPSPLR